MLVPMEATVPWPAWGIHTSSKSVTQKANAAWKCFPQSYEIKPQHCASSCCQAASCHPEEVSPGFLIYTPMPGHWWDLSSATPGSTCARLTASQHKALCSRRAWSRNTGFQLSGHPHFKPSAWGGRLMLHNVAMALLQDVGK